MKTASTPKSQIIRIFKKVETKQMQIIQTIPVSCEIRRVKRLNKIETDQIKDIELECKLSRWDKTDYMNEPERESSIFLIAGNKDAVYGFLLARFFKDNSNDPLEILIAEKKKEQLESEADLLNFGVLENYRGQGIGERLFRNFVQILCEEKIRSIWLEVRKTNSNAISFYTDRGFEVVQTRKNFYSEPVEDALVLKLSLKSILCR